MIELTVSDKSFIVVCMTNHSSEAAAVSNRVAGDLRAELGRRKLSRADLARVLGVTPQTAASRLDNETDFNIRELAVVSEWLDIPLAQLTDPTYRPTASPRARRSLGRAA